MKSLLLSISKANNHLLQERILDTALNLCISDIGLGQQMDRCYIFRNVVEDGVFKLYYSYEWCNEGVEPFIDSPDLNGISYSNLPGLYDTLSKDKPMYGSVAAIDNEFFKAAMAMQGIQSYLFTPIFSDNFFWGWIGYDDCQNARKWADEEVFALHTIAKNIGIRLSHERTNAELATTLQKMDYYMSSSNQAMWEIDFETKNTILSYNWAGMLGYSLDEIDDGFEFWKERVHPEEIDQILIDLENYIAGKSDSYSGITRILHKDGYYIWIKYAGLIIKDEAGRSQKIIGTHIDISELKEKEKQLELSESKFRFIAENTSDLICQHSRSGNFSYVSNSCKDILGYSPEDLMHKKPSDYIHKYDLNKVEIYFREILENSQNGRLVYRIRNKKGCFIWLETSTKVIFDIEGFFLGFQTSSRDISSRIKAEMDLNTAFVKERKFNELKSKFVSMASHQFRTPLTVIYSNAELLDLKTISFGKKISDEFAAITTRIRNEVDRMTELMNNILIFGKHESKKIEKKIYPINLNEFVKTIIKTYFDNENFGRKIKVQTKGVKKLFYTDETLIVHILTNVISNAFKYSAGQSSPLLIINYLEKEIEIEVIDFGIGIPEKEIQYLFTSFFRASNTSTIIGSGLGLVIVKQFTNFLGGKIEIKTKEGTGTTVKLTFPYEQ